MIKKYKVANPLDISTLGKIIQTFQSNDVPAFKRRYNYYLGKHSILQRTMDDGKPNNRIVSNFCRAITQNFLGYGLGLPVSYSGDGIESIMDVLNYNDILDADTAFYRDGLIYGRGIEISYIDRDGQTRFKVLPPTEVIPVYDNTIEENLLYCIRIISNEFYEDLTPSYLVEVYDGITRTTYKSEAGFASFAFIDQEPHHFAQVPFSIFEINPEIESVFEQIVTLQDAYNSLVSDSVNDWDAWCDAYLVLKGAVADADDLTAMKQNRCLLLDQDSDASFLTKSASDTEINNLLDRTEKKIWEMAHCVNFSDEVFGTASGVSLRYKLMGMEDLTSSMINYFKKALQKRIELICDILSLKGEDWRDINITFKRNIPTDMSENANVVSQLSGLVSDETLLSLLPFVNDPVEELKKVAAEKNTKLELYTPYKEVMSNGEEA